MRYVHHVVSSTCLISHSSLFQNIFSLRQSDDLLRIIFVTYFIGDIYHSYTTPFPIILLSEKYKYIFSLGNISHLSIISYLWFPCEPITCKLHVTVFIAYNLGSAISNLLVYLVLKSPPCVPQWTSLVVLFFNFYVCLPSIIEKLDLGSSRILSGLNLTLLSLTLIYPYITGIWCIILVFFVMLTILLK